MKFLKRLQDEGGVTIIENLIAISLLTLVISSTSRFIIYAMQANKSARTHTAVAAEIQKKIDGYRTSAYTQLLSKFGSSYSAIQDGQTAIEQTASSDAWTSYSTTYTAVKTSNTAYPEAIKVKIDATQRRGNLGSATFSFETYIAQIR